MTILGGWVLTPLVLVLLAAGHGLLLERAAGIRLPGLLVPAAGLAGLITLGGLLTIADVTAEAAAPACALAALAGFAVAWRGRRLRLDREAVVALCVAAGAYGLFAGPSLLSGQASVAGYVKLDDSPTWLALTAYVMDHGLQVDGLALSSYARTLEAWLGGDYPVGAFLPLGIASWLAATDPLAAYQAVIAVSAALLALGLMAVARPLAGTPVRAGAAALVAVQASLFFGYAQWGGIKEGVATALLPPLTLCAVLARSDPRMLFAVAVAAGGLMDVLGVNGAVWVAPAVGLAVAGALWRQPRRRPSARVLGACAGVLLVAALPVLVSIDFVRHTTTGAITNAEDIGNLAKPLPLLQGAGLWPVGDFRFDPSPRWAAVAIALVCLLAALAACAAAARERRAAVPALLAVAVAGAVPAIVVGSPWIDAKALAIVSPTVLLAAAVLAFRRDPGAPGPVVAARTALAVALPAAAAWSTLSIYADVQIAPRDRLVEAHDLGELLAGHGPTLVLDPEHYSTRYLLRYADAEGASDLRYRPVKRYDGAQFPHLTTAEVDEVAVADLWVYRAIVRRASPTASRPPSAFHPVHDGSLWEAWGRPTEAPPPVARLPLGGGTDPTAVPGCDAVRSLARTPGAQRLSASVRTPPVVVGLNPANAPPGWNAGETVRPSVDGTFTLAVDVPVEGRWRLWVGGGILGRLEAAVDDRPLGARAHEIAHGPGWLRFAAAPLTAGRHLVQLRYERGSRPGRGGPPWPLGPIALSLEDDGHTIEVPVRRWRELCDGRRLDWVEALGP